MKSTLARITPIIIVMMLLLSIMSAFLSAGTAAAQPPPSAVTSLSVGPLPISFGYSPAEGYVYVGSFTSGVSVVSGTSLVGDIPPNDIGSLPRAFAYDSSNREEYVAAGDRLSVISGASAAVNGPDGGATPQAVVYDPSDGYVTVANLGSIIVLSSSNALEANITAYPRPGGLVYDPLDDYTYASYIMQNGAGVQTGTEVYAMSGGTLVGNVTLASGGGGFVPPVYDACHDYVYLANTNLASVSVVWGTTLVGTVPAGQEPAALAYDDSNHYVYVANADAGTVSVLNGTNVVGSVNVGSAPTAIAYDPYDGYVYAVNDGSGTVSVISGTTVVETVSVGEDPVAIIYNPSNNDMYVANNGSGTVSVIPSVGPPVSNGSPTDCSPVRAAYTESTTTVACATPITVGTPSSCSIAVKGYGTPSGTVGAFTSTGSGTFDANSCTLSGGGCTVRYTPASAFGSPHLISATYEGDADNAASNATGGNRGSVTVNQATTTTSLSCSSPVTGGAPFACAATVSGAFGTTAGEQVSFIASGSGSFDATSCLLSSGSCTVHYDPGVAGSPQTISATYPGDVNNAGSSGTASVTIDQASTTTALSCASPVSEGTPSTCTATVSGENGSTNGEAVSFAASGSGAFSSGGTCTLSAGSCSLTYAPESVAGSSQTITAAYPGDASNAGSSGTASVAVKTASTTTTVDCASPVTVGTPSICSATVTGYGTPSGSMSFSSTGSVASPSGGACTLSDGTCSVTYTPTSASGSPFTITGTYSGDANDAESSATLSVTITRATSSTAVTCATPANAGAPSSCSVTVSGYGTPSGNVSFSASGAGSFDATSCTLSSGACTVHYAPTSASGSPQTITAAYSGDTNDVGSSGTTTTTSAATSATSTTPLSLVGQPTPHTPAISTPVLIIVVIFVALAGTILLVNRRSGRA